ncbi:hypothetical protein [Oryza sativa Japonica Group]|uniref:Uncharacterized protein P0510F03.14 n=1 Tax=Oryza sativa subsp. japonica TaxID=39947 RepID=Q5VRX7_ORYSJ|nr:hypothetical protein [Oryza sativa Japonica Group]
MAGGDGQACGWSRWRGDVSALEQAVSPGERGCGGGKRRASVTAGKRQLRAWAEKLRPVPSKPGNLSFFDLMSIPGKLRAGLGALGIRPPPPLIHPPPAATSPSAAGIPSRSRSPSRISPPPPAAVAHNPPPLSPTVAPAPACFACRGRARPPPLPPLSPAVAPHVSARRRRREKRRKGKKEGMWGPHHFLSLTWANIPGFVVEGPQKISLLN